MRASLERAGRLRFDDGTPVRAASAVARLGDGWLVAQDDATAAAWVRGTSVTRLRLLPPVESRDVFAEADGTKHLKPDVEACCQVEVAGAAGVLLLGSGSAAARMRAVLVLLDGPEPRVEVADLTSLYAEVASVLGLALDDLNLEGACRLGDRLRWFQRGVGTRVPSGSVDLDLDALLAYVVGGAAAPSVGDPRRYDLGEVEGVGLTVTDAVALPDGRVLVSAAAEDTPNNVDDGPVVGTALVLLDDDGVLAVAPLPEPDGEPLKVEGLALEEVLADGLRLRAVVDADDPEVPSDELVLRVTWEDQ